MAAGVLLPVPASPAGAEVTPEPGVGEPVAEVPPGCVDGH